MRRAFALNSASAGDSLNVGAFFLNTSAGCLKVGAYFSNAGAIFLNAGAGCVNA